MKLSRNFMKPSSKFPSKERQITSETRPVDYWITIKCQWKSLLTPRMATCWLDEENQLATDELARFDQSRKDRNVSNEEWGSEADQASRIAKIKDGTTHLARQTVEIARRPDAWGRHRLALLHGLEAHATPCKAENVVDLKSDLILSAEIYAADQGDARTAVDSLVETQTNRIAAGSPETIADAAADKDYHSAKTLDEFAALNIRTYVSEPKQNHRRRWSDKPAGGQKAVYANRRRMKREKGRPLQRTRSELIMQTFAPMCETGGARRSWLRGIDKVKKRWIISAL